MRTRADSPTKTCTKLDCASPLRARGLCSTHYNQRHQPDRHRSTSTVCTVCEAPVLRPARGSRRPACSPECRHTLTFGSAPGSSYDWARDAAQRARRAGAAVVELIQRDDVFERDGWICYLCGGRVNRDASVFHPDSPTVDHVTPLSRGGQHVMVNVRCAHLRCNSSKGDHTP